MTKFIVLASFIFCATAVAQASKPNQPDTTLLWKVEGEPLEQPSYLFGTIHLGGGRLNTLHPAAEQAFQEADVFYAEIPLDPGTQVAAMQGLVRKDGETLSGSIGPELAARLTEELKRINDHLDITPFERLHTWVIATALPILEFQLQGGTALDNVLWNRAQKEGKELDSIETVDSQFAIFNSLTEREQVIMLEATLDFMSSSRERGVDLIRATIDAYIRGDAIAIREIVNASLEEMTAGEHRELGEKLFAKLVTDRDAEMARTIVSRLEGAPQKTHFFAAGTAHLVGKESIVSHLQKAGYRVTRVEK
mgnify:FL=1